MYLNVRNIGLVWISISYTTHDLCIAHHQLLALTDIIQQPSYPQLPTSQGATLGNGQEGVHCEVPGGWSARKRSLGGPKC